MLFHVLTVTEVFHGRVHVTTVDLCGWWETDLSTSASPLLTCWIQLSMRSYGPQLHQLSQSVIAVFGDGGGQRRRSISLLDDPFLFVNAIPFKIRSSGEHPFISSPTLCKPLSDLVLFAQYKAGAIFISLQPKSSIVTDINIFIELLCSGKNLILSFDFY